ncbi:hypothetical protein R1sor_002305 [Riccia sorocarpa]|uniref:Uncharacterized protein n=1 Tax=Riccia sorocarpa TaxID=122646 RepID=A0ABD3GYS4_9MARC
MFDNRENVETIEQQDVVFAGGSSSFRNANVTSFQARKAVRDAVDERRSPLVETTNTYRGAARSASVSPECKKQEQKPETKVEVEEVHSQKNAAVTRAEEDFTPVTGRKAQEQTPAKVLSANPYEALAVEEVQEVLQEAGKEKTEVEVSVPGVTATEVQLTTPSSAEMEVDKETKRKQEAQSKESKEAVAEGEEKVMVTTPEPGTSQVQGANKPGSQSKAIRKSKRGTNAGTQKGAPNHTTVS